MFFTKSKIHDAAMSKKQKHAEELVKIFKTLATRETWEELYSYIITNSNLPGPRGNLELAAAFEEIISSQSAISTPKQLWELCSEMTNLSAEYAPTNDPKEFIAFCGTRGLGAIGTSFPEYQEKALIHLKNLAKDPRWRMREAVAMTLQRLLSGGDIKIRRKLDDWIEQGDWSVLRGVMAGIAEPRLLLDSGFAEWALEAHMKVLDRIAKSPNRESEEFRTLRKALGYTLSVIVQAKPSAGFHYLETLIERDDTDIKWIVKQNLTKKRLATNFPREVDLLIRKVR